MKKLKPRKLKPKPWPHPFGKLAVPKGAVVQDGGWPCKEAHEGESGDRDYEADCEETKA